MATLLEEEVQFTEVVRFCVLPSPKVPVAVSCSKVSNASFEVDGVMVILTSAEGVTSRLVVPVTVEPESWAEMMVLPWP